MRIDSTESASLEAGRAGRISRTERRFIAVLGFALVTALAARVAVPLPGTAVPFTLQVVAVLLAGIVLGPRLGAASQAVYVVVGFAGLPVFTAGGGPAYLLGPTAGYLIAFPAAAAVAGFISWRRSGIGWVALACVLAMLTVHLGGASWIAITMGREAAAVALGSFVAGDALKIALVLLIGSRLRGWGKRLVG